MFSTQNRALKVLIQCVHQIYWLKYIFDPYRFHCLLVKYLCFSSSKENLLRNYAKCSFVSPQENRAGVRGY